MARNALVVLSNLAYPELLPLALKAAQDVNPVVRATAAQALARLGERALLERFFQDPDPKVAGVARGLREAL
jgi:HEAT repeat protein